MKTAIRSTQTVWGVIDPRGYSQFGDVYFATNMDALALTFSGGMDPVAENLVIYTDEEEAKADARDRMKRRDTLAERKAAS